MTGLLLVSILSIAALAQDDMTCTPAESNCVTTEAAPPPHVCGEGPVIVQIRYQACDDSCNVTSCDYEPNDDGSYSEGWCVRTAIACCKKGDRWEVWTDWPECGGKKK